jgi:hypothetical protein
MQCFAFIQLKAVNLQQDADALNKMSASEYQTYYDSLPDIVQSQEGYQSMGQVYRDPETGKLILISND